VGNRVLQVNHRLLVWWRARSYRPSEPGGHHPGLLQQNGTSETRRIRLPSKLAPAFTSWVFGCKKASWLPLRAFDRLRISQDELAHREKVASLETISSGGSTALIPTRRITGFLKTRSGRSFRPAMVIFGSLRGLACWASMASASGFSTQKTLRGCLATNSTLIACWRTARERSGWVRRRRAIWTLRTPVFHGGRTVN